jgi:hypothetical protein
MELADMPGHPARLAASRHKAAVEQWLTAQFAAKHVHKPAILARQVVLLAGETARRLIKHHYSE